MSTLLLGLLAETPVHPGAGQSSGVIDLPVAREAATDYPVITGSSLKGALRDYARDLDSSATGEMLSAEEPEKESQSEQDSAEIKTLFGKSDSAGALLISDARLLLLPVRSLHSAYKWATCPHLIERFLRDSNRVGKDTRIDIPSPAPNSYIGTDVGNLFLEERQFISTGGNVDDLVQIVEGLVTHESTRKRLANQTVVLNDDDFAWFARNGLGIQARNVLDKDTKESRNLWYEEFIPSDALFYAVISERFPGSVEAMDALFKKRPYVQIGGNETVGHGWFAVTSTVLGRI